MVGSRYRNPTDLSVGVVSYNWKNAEKTCKISEHVYADIAAGQAIRVMADKNGITKLLNVA